MVLKTINKRAAIDVMVMDSFDARNKQIPRKFKYKKIFDKLFYKGKSKRTNLYREKLLILVY